jgi:hypothetical protein
MNLSDSEGKNLQQYLNFNSNMPHACTAVNNQPSQDDKEDELWLGVKCHSNPELAGSPRNALRHSS